LYQIKVFNWKWEWNTGLLLCSSDGSETQALQSAIFLLFIFSQF